MTPDLKYKNGTKLKVLKSFISEFDEEIPIGALVEVMASPTFERAYEFVDTDQEDYCGWTKEFIESPSNFAPLKVDNWREEINDV